MTIQFSQQGMAALPLHVRPGHTSLVRRLLSARNDPAKARVLAWLVKIDDERLAGYGFTSEDIAILRSRSSGTSPCGSQILPTSPRSGSEPERRSTHLDVNANFNERVSVHAAKLPWKASPIPGVERRMLDRLGDEVARATTIVRYAPKSSFSPHIHSGGEEFFVLEGVFQDEHGDFPAGSYIRNPPKSKHTPGSELGCTIFVKLWQFDLADRTHVRIDTNKMAFVPDRERAGVEIMPLFLDNREDVRLERWAPGVTVALDASGGMEVLVLAGSFSERGEAFPLQSWLRLPKDGVAWATVGVNGARVWIKRGHLTEIPRPPA